MRARLSGVRVEAVQRDVEKSSAQASVDELGRQLQMVRQRAIRIWHARLVGLANLPQALAAGVGVDGRALHEIKKTATGARGCRRRRGLDRLLLCAPVSTVR